MTNLNDFLDSEFSEAERAEIQLIADEMILDTGLQLPQTIGQPPGERFTQRRIVLVQHSVGQVCTMACQNGEIGGGINGDGK
ncbi:hypothetical protein ABK905_03655 [Acerihabitans sp. KWT182]|uniref:Uncharacterized protein n=1 Tax=Acerihabitans sp. KWT182 TaxID=3157919 RepID=A0AAU7QIQ4_9GAMM